MLAAGAFTIKPLCLLFPPLFLVFLQNIKLKTNTRPGVKLMNQRKDMAVSPFSTHLLVRWFLLV